LRILPEARDVPPQIVTISAEIIIIMPYLLIFITYSSKKNPNLLFGNWDAHT
jgi:hypothetical protein